MHLKAEILISVLPYAILSLERRVGQFFSIDPEFSFSLSAVAVSVCICSICKIRFKHLRLKTWQRISFLLNYKWVIFAEGK